MLESIKGKSYCPSLMTNSRQERCFGEECHFWDEKENTCQEIVNTQLLRDIKGLLTILVENKGKKGGQK